MNSPVSTKAYEVKQALRDSIIWRGLYYVVTFILNVLLARFFGSALSGLVLYVIAYYTLFVLVFGFSLESGIGYYASKKEINPSRLLNLAILWSLGACILTLILFTVYIPASFSGLTFTFIVVSSMIYITGHILIAFCNGFYYAQKNFRLPNLVAVIINLLLIAILIAIGADSLSTREINLYLYLFFGSSLLQGLVLLIGAFVYFRIPWKISLAGMGEYTLLVQYSFRAFISNLVFFLLYRIDYWFVEKFCLPDDMGNYMQASKLANIFLVLPTIIGSAIFPLTAGGNRLEVNQKLQAIAKAIFFGYLAILLLMVLIGSPLLVMIYGEEFVELPLVFMVLSPGILALATLSPFSAYYAGKDRIAVNIKGSLLALAVIVAGDLIFIPKGGILAAAAVSSAGYIVYQLYVMITFVREYKLSLAGFFTLDKQDLNLIRWLLVKSSFNKDRDGSD